MAVSAIMPDNDSNRRRVAAHLCLSHRGEFRLLGKAIESNLRRKHFVVQTATRFWIAQRKN